MPTPRQINDAQNFGMYSSIDTQLLASADTIKLVNGEFDLEQLSAIQNYYPGYTVARTSNGLMFAPKPETLTQ